MNEAQYLKELETQARIRGIVKQLEQIAIGDLGASRDFMQWLVTMLDTIIQLVGEGETGKQLKEIREEATKAQDENKELVIRSILPRLRQLIW